MLKNICICSWFKFESDNTCRSVHIHLIISYCPLKQRINLYLLDAYPGGDSHMKLTGMLVVSLRGVNFRFWSRLGFSGQNVIVFSRQVLI